MWIRLKCQTKCDCLWITSQWDMPSWAIAHADDLTYKFCYLIGELTKSSKYEFFQTPP